MQQQFELYRKNMIECQVRPNKVTDENLLAAMRDVPREKFLPPHLQNMAYADEDIAVGNGRYLLEPTVLARLLQAANVRKEDVVLDVGCGTGYATAILGRLSGKVVGLESDQKMAVEASGLMKQLRVPNAEIVHAARAQDGYTPKGPYDVILIGGAVAAVSDTIKSQLADGGRLVTVVSRKGHGGSGVLITRHGDSFSTHSLFDAAIPFLPGFEEKKAFVF